MSAAHLSIRDTEVPKSTPAEVLVDKAAAPIVTFPAALSFTTFLLGSVPVTLPVWNVWNYLGWEIVLPFLWLAFIASLPFVRTRFETFNRPGNLHRGPAYLLIGVLLAGYVAWFILHLPLAVVGLDISEPGEATDVFVSGGSAPPSRPAPPMPSALLPPTQSKAYQELKKQYEAERDARVRAEGRSRGSAASGPAPGTPTAPPSNGGSAAPAPPPPPLVRPNLPPVATNTCVAQRPTANLDQIEKALDEGYRLRQDYVATRGDALSERSMVNFGNSSGLPSALRTFVGRACVAPYERIQPLEGPLDQVPADFPVDKEGPLRKFDAQLAHVEQVLTVLREQRSGAK